jgi:hypothetical protein
MALLPSSLVVMARSCSRVLDHDWKGRHHSWLS